MLALYCIVWAGAGPLCAGGRPPKASTTAPSRGSVAAKAGLRTVRETVGAPPTKLLVVEEGGGGEGPRGAPGVPVAGRIYGIRAPQQRGYRSLVRVGTQSCARSAARSRRFCSQRRTRSWCRHAQTVLAIQIQRPAAHGAPPHQLPASASSSSLLACLFAYLLASFVSPRLQKCP